MARRVVLVLRKKGPRPAHPLNSQRKPLLFYASILATLADPRKNLLGRSQRDPFFSDAAGHGNKFLAEELLRLSFITLDIFIAMG